MVLMLLCKLSACISHVHVWDLFCIGCNGLDSQSCKCAKAML